MTRHPRASAAYRVAGGCAVEQAPLACEVARRLGDGELEMRGLHIHGRVMLRRGEVEEGASLPAEAQPS